MKLSAFYFELDVWEARSLETSGGLKRKLGISVVDGMVSLLLVPQRFSPDYLLYVSVGNETPLWVRRERTMPYAWVNEVSRGYYGTWMLCDQVFSGIFFSIPEGTHIAPLTVIVRAGFAYLSLDKELVRFNKVVRVVQVETKVETDEEQLNKVVHSTIMIAERFGLPIK